jgi:hypothetical protein
MLTTLLNNANPVPRKKWSFGSAVFFKKSIAQLWARYGSRIFSCNVWSKV